VYELNCAALVLYVVPKLVRLCSREC